jgi:hypothetical protein
MGAVKQAMDARQWPQVTAHGNQLADVLFYLEDA